MATNHKEVDKDLEKDEPWTFLIITFSVVVLLWLTSYFVIAWIITDSKERGPFGDTYGAINSLFSGLAFGGIIYTIQLQRKELKLQRLELIETRKELRRSADAQEKSEVALNRQAENLKISATLTALTTLLEHYSSESRMGILANKQTGLRKKMEYVHRIEQILERKENS